MTSQPHDTPTPLTHPGLNKLDAEPGPARWLSTQAAGILVSSTLQAHAKRKQQRHSRVIQLAAGLTLFLGLSAVVSAAFLFRLRPSPATPQPAIEVVPPPPVIEQEEAAPPAESPQGAQEPLASPETRRVHAPPSASDLLAQANQLRRQARWVEAAHAYERAVRSAPRSQEAYAAMVAAGGLYVDKLRDPRRGAKLFQRALAARPAGALAEEARWGLAQAYKGLRKPSAERGALRSFLQHHPHGALSAQAEARLKVLAR